MTHGITGPVTRRGRKNAAQEDKLAAPEVSDDVPVPPRAARSKKPISKVEEVKPKSTRARKPTSKATPLPVTDDEPDELDMLGTMAAAKTTRPTRKTTKLSVKDEEPNPTMVVQEPQGTKGRKKPDSSAPRRVALREASPAAEKENEKEVVKVRVSRTRKAKEEPQTEPEPATRTRVTRSKAART